MCQVQAGAYVSLLAPEKTDYAACYPGKTTTYILHVVPTTTYTHVRLKSIGKKNKQKKKKEEKGKGKKKRKRKRKEQKRQDKTRM